MHIFKTDSKKTLLIVIVFILFSIVYSAWWALVSQWREDQSVNLWLGYVNSPFNLPIGLISSTGLPNPNGMPLLGVLLSRLPGLMSVSIVLGTVQALLAFWVCWQIAGSSNLLFLLFLPVFSNVILRAVSVEFWNNWILTSVNLIFIGTWISYLKHPSPWKCIIFIFCSLLAPALYLGGLANTVVYALLAAGLVIFRFPTNKKREWILTIGFVLVLLIIALIFTWIPYFRQVSPSIFLRGNPASNVSIKNRLISAFQTLIKLPLWNILQWSINTKSNFPFFHNSSEILSPWSWKALNLTTWFNFGQSLLFTLALFAGGTYAFVRKGLKKSFLSNEIPFAGYAVFVCFLFIILLYCVSPLLGGPVFSLEQRRDQTVQIFPFFLIAWFSVGWVINLPKQMRDFTRAVSIFICILSVVVNFGLGYFMVKDYLNYRGDFLSEADVPLIQKLQVSDYIAQDWKSENADNQINVEYDLGGGRWDWLENFGEQLNPWYPNTMTYGRGFDFELLRTHGLLNIHWELEYKKPKGIRYIVSYSFLPLNNYGFKILSNKLVGRFRVTKIL